MITFENRDCMEAMREFPDKYFDLAIVDPIYGDVTTGGYTSDLNDNKKSYYGHAATVNRAYNREIWRQPKTPPQYFTELFRVSKNQIIWGGNYFVECLPDSQGWIVWDKQKPEGFSFADCELAFTSFNRATRIFRFMWNGMLQGDMRNKEDRIHPTQKPVALYKWLLDNYAKPGFKILDTHVGSGSSLIACYDRGFDCWGYEIDRVYYQAAKQRLDDEMAQLRIPLDMLTP